jgi:hypothetical protein
MTVGEKISIVAEHLSDMLLQNEISNEDTPPGFTDEGLSSIIHLFSGALMDRVWALQEREEMDFEDRVAMIESLGEKIREIVKTYADIDTHELPL